MKKLILLLSMCAALASFGQDTNTFAVTSSAFKPNTMIPEKYSCRGENINPELLLKDLPKGAKTIALIMDDPDAPKSTFVHWVMWNIPVAKIIAENSAPGIQGNNGRGETKYTGPCPPSGIHHYFFKVYALDTTLSIAAGSDKKVLEEVMRGHIIGKAELIGLYKK
jgi:Raf kinase inhibitor-like YbhB/YbcL family protein